MRLPLDDIWEIIMEWTDNSKLSLFRKFHKDSFEALTINVFGHDVLTEKVFKYSINYTV